MTIEMAGTNINSNERNSVNYLEFLKGTDAKIVCYGCSDNGRRTLEFLSRFDIKVSYFADTFKQGIDFQGRKGISPDR